MSSLPLQLIVGDPQHPPRIFDLEQPRTATMPIHPAHRPGYSYVLHRRHEDSYGQDGPRSGASGMIVCMEHTGTHIDAPCHQADHLTLCGGVPVDASIQSSRGFTRHAVDEIPPLVAPGVLLDMTAHHGIDALPAGYAVTAAELQACARRQGAEIAAGIVARLACPSVTCTCLGYFLHPAA